MQKGIFWESAMAAKHFGLNNLYLLMDLNGLQIDGKVKHVMNIDPVERKLREFGWDVFSVIDPKELGDDDPKSEVKNLIEYILRLEDVFNKVDYFDNPSVPRPKAIVLRTIKGRGFPDIENKPEYHGKISVAECKSGIEFTDRLKDILEGYDIGDLREKEEAVNNNNHLRWKSWFEGSAERIKIRPITESFIITSSKKPESMRGRYGEALCELKETYPLLTVLDADLSNSTKTNIFAKKYPEAFYNVGIAEGNLAGVASGLCAAGIDPVFMSTFAVFATNNTIEVLRQTVAPSNIPIKIVASHTGFVGEDGHSHHGCDDVALIKQLPNFYIIKPVDGNETELAVKAIAGLKNPVYLAIPRDTTPFVLPEGCEFVLGKGYKLVDGDDSRIAIVSTGASPTYEAKKVAEKYNVPLFVFSTIRPIDSGLVEKIFTEYDGLLVVDEHLRDGCLYDFMEQAYLEKNGKTPSVYVEFAVLPREYLQSAPVQDLRKYYGLDASGIEMKLRSLEERIG